jgi:hypothetical protein
MLFSLDVIRAGEGDCMILHYGPKSKPRLVLIDGGPRGVYGEFLKERLKVIKENRGLGPNQPLPIELLMVSHMDDDHILGILDLTRDLIQDDPTFARVRSFWHNSFNNVIGDVPPELTAAFTAQFGAASPDDPPPHLTLDVEKDEKEVVSSLKFLASIKNGAKLRRDIIDNLNAEPNPHFGGKLIAAEENAKAIDMKDGLKFTVAGPMLPELEDLHAEHQAWLAGLAKKGQTPEEVLAAYVDRSPTNLSSIVVLAEAEGKRILFTGDALGNKIMKGLELVGIIEPGGSLHVDVLKVQHHGSDRNAALDFYQRITADHYVYSGDGKHGNPERDSFEWLLQARGEEDDYTIHLTYPISEIDPAREADWLSKQNEEKKRKLTKPATKVRADWSPEEHSLHAFFKQHKEFAKRLSIVEEGEPHVIDLLEELGF